MLKQNLELIIFITQREKWNQEKLSRINDLVLHKNETISRKKAHQC